MITKEQALANILAKQANRQAKPLREMVTDIASATGAVAGTVKELAETAEIMAMSLKFQSINDMLSELEPTSV